MKMNLLNKQGIKIGFQYLCKGRTNCNLCKLFLSAGKINPEWIQFCQEWFKDHFWAGCSSSWPNLEIFDNGWFPLGIFVTWETSLDIKYSSWRPAFKYQMPSDLQTFREGSDACKTFIYIPWEPEGTLAAAIPDLRTFQKNARDLKNPYLCESNVLEQFENPI